MTCPLCKAGLALLPGRRVLCVECGGDFGRAIEGPLKIPVAEVDDFFEPNLVFLTKLLEDAILES